MKDKFKLQSSDPNAKGRILLIIGKHPKNSPYLWVGDADSCFGHISDESLRNLAHSILEAIGDKKP